MTGIYRSLRQRLADSLPAGSLRARMAHGAAWSLVGAVASQGTATLASIVAARLLGKAGFGELGMIRYTLSMFGVLAGLGLGMTASKFVAELRVADPRRAGRIVALTYGVSIVGGLLVLVGIVAFARPLAGRSLSAPSLAWPLVLASPLVLLGALNGVQGGVAAGFEAFRRLSAWSSAGAVVTAVATILGILWRGLEGAVVGTVVAGLFATAGLHYVVATECRRAGIAVEWRAALREAGVLWRFALPSLLSGLLVSPVIWAANAVLAARPGGYGELGVLNAAMQWRSVVLFVPGVVAQAALPILASLQSARDAARFARALRVNCALNLAVGILAGLPIAAASPWIMRTYGPEFAGRGTVLAVLVASAVLQAVVGVVGQALASLGRLWWGLGLNVLWAAELLLATHLLLPLGADGLAIAFLVSYFLHLVQVGLYVELSLRYDLAGLAPGAAPAAAAPAAVAVAAHAGREPNP